LQSILKTDLVVGGLTILECKGLHLHYFATLFSKSDEIKLKKTPVYDRDDNILSDKEAEAVTVDVDGKIYTLLVVHNSPAPAVHFYRVNGIFVHGEVVLIETNKETNTITVIKE